MPAPLIDVSEGMALFEWHRACRCLPSTSSTTLTLGEVAADLLEAFDHGDSQLPEVLSRQPRLLQALRGMARRVLAA